MKNLYFILFIVIQISNLFGAPWDTGYILWEQPNGTTFTARSWGDEFESWMETDDGYQIIIGPDKYFYYAILDENGEFTYSANKVAIDEPLQVSYQLERSPQRLVEIEAEIEAFKQQLEDNYNDYMTNFSGPTYPPMRVAIVLIDFADNLHKDYYNKEDFDTLFFSTGYYYTITVRTGPKSPDEDWVYGSLRDYYRDQSLNKLEIKGKFGSDRSIVNPVDPNNPDKPLWVNMPEEKSFYYSLSKYSAMILAKNEAEAQLNLDLDQYDRVGFIWAGDGNTNWGGLKAGSSGDMFSSYERYKGSLSDYETFAHIGIPAHEFAHTLGAADEYEGGPKNDPQRWSLMSYGVYNGGDNTNENGKGSCPASLSPAYRIRFNWVTPIELEPQADFVVQYNYSSPYFYKINIPGSNEYFIVERRRKEGYDLYTPKYEDPNNPPKGILIWHIAPDKFFPDFDLVQLEPANNQFPVGFNGVRFPLNSVQDFTDFTLPSSHKRNGDPSFISIKNIEWIGNLQTGYAKLDYINEVIEITGTQTWSTNTSLALPVYIKDGGTLNITNGADVLINGDFVEQVKFVVEDGGTFNLTGSENNNVVILSGDFEQPIEEWGGIEIFGSGTLVSNFSRIQDAIYPIQVFQDNATCSLNNTKIVGNTVTLSGNVTIENSIFNDASLIIRQSNNGSKLNRTIFSSTLPNDLTVQLMFPATSYLEVTNCTFNGMDYGLWIADWSRRSDFW